jgi:hypothetical protein
LLDDVRRSALLAHRREYEMRLRVERQAQRLAQAHAELVLEHQEWHQ